ncbi:MAG: hypothetical protein HYZ40_07350 [Rhodospirillales bacterium]|nr:hypothetical protein [Rhodospirillales bacterium]
MNARFAMALSVGLLAAACQSPQQTRYITPSGPPTMSSAVFWSSEQACIDYGFTPGTTAYGNCVSRERAARAGGRVSADYAEVNLARDAQDACYSYGLQPRTAAFDRCVGREVDARRYRSEAVAPTYPPYRYDRYGYRIDAQGYRVDADGYRLAGGASYAPPAIVSRPAATGEVAFRDEFGFRYDDQGNRIDRNGRIISPQTKTP